MTVHLSPNSLVGSWRVLQRIGNGSYGAVYRAVHKDRPQAGHYALKVALKAGDERFEREAYLLSRIRHPSVPRFEERGIWTSPEGEDHPYIVMEWVEGISMYAWALEHGLTLRQTIGQLAQVARALQATHLYGVHRDVKGGNVRVNPEGRAVLLDFGSCWYSSASPLTGRAVPPGTPEYRSPALLFFEFALKKGAAEHYVSQPADDVYALGVTAYRLLAGGYPPSDPAEVEAPRGLEDKCPELGELIVRLLSEDPVARGSARKVAEELEALLEYSRPSLDEPWVANASRQPTAKAVPLIPDGDAPRRPPRVVPSASKEPSPRVAPVAPKEPSPHVAPSAPESSASRVASAAPGDPLPRVAPAAPEEASSGAASAAAEDQASCLALVVVFIVLVALVVVLTVSVSRTEVASTGQGSTRYGTGSPDAGPAGLGEEGLASVSPAETPQASSEKEQVTREVPSEPLSGQRLPPCPQRGAVVINGGCWRRPSVEAEVAPCDSEDLYEHKGRCYSPILISGRRVPTSKDP
jgi:serine/threonine protein kinase